MRWNIVRIAAGKRQTPCGRRHVAFRELKRTPTRKKTSTSKLGAGGRLWTLDDTVNVENGEKDDEEGDEEGGEEQAIQNRKLTTSPKSTVG